MRYKELERDAKLGNQRARKMLEERRVQLELLPIRDAMGCSLTWCPNAVPKQIGRAHV